MTAPIIVTGATGALGRVVCETLVTSGHRIISVDRSKPKADFPYAKGGMVLDLSNREATIAGLSEVPEASGLVCIVGGFTMGPKVWEVDPNSLDGMAPVNIGTMLNTIAGALPALKALSSLSVLVPVSIIRVGPGWEPMLHPRRRLFV